MKKTQMQFRIVIINSEQKKTETCKLFTIILIHSHFSLCVCVGVTYFMSKRLVNLKLEKI